MKKTALILIGCGLMASIPGAFADNSASVTKVKVSDAQCDTSERPPKFTDDQLERMHKIKTKYEDSSASRGMELHKLHRQIFEALDQSTVDKAGILAIQSKINGLEADQSNDRIQMMVDMHDVFTPEQRQSMHRHVLEHDVFNHGGPGMHQPGGPGGFGGFGGHPGPGMMPPPGAPHP